MSKVTKLVNVGVKLAQFSKPRLQKFWYYAKVELAPPKISEIPIIIKSAKNLVDSFKSGRWKEVTMKDAFLNAMVTTEVLLWFTVGKCIGKRKIKGYAIH